MYEKIRSMSTPRSATARATVHRRSAIPGEAPFDSSEDYYATLLHEGSQHGASEPVGPLPGVRCRPSLGSADYSREELVAEMGAALLCAEGGISCATIENQAAYVAGWLKCLEEDSRAVVIAAAQAQRAADLILGRRPEAQ